MSAKIKEKHEREYQIIYFGRLTKDKNIHVIVETFNLINKKIPNSKLYLIGNFKDLNYKNHIISLINEKGINI